MNTELEDIVRLRYLYFQYNQPILYPLYKQNKWLNDNNIHLIFPADKRVIFRYNRIAHLEPDIEWRKLHDFTDEKFNIYLKLKDI